MVPDAGLVEGLLQLRQRGAGREQDRDVGQGDVTPALPDGRQAGVLLVDLPPLGERGADGGDHVGGLASA